MTGGDSRARSPALRAYDCSVRGLRMTPSIGRLNAGGEVYSRHSNGLEQFFDHIQGEQGSATFSTSPVSRRPMSDSSRTGLQALLGGLHPNPRFRFRRPKATPTRTSRSLLASTNSWTRTSTSRKGHLDGVLLWDVFEFVAPALLKAIIERLRRAVKPGSYLLAMFHAEERAGQLPVFLLPAFPMPRRCVLRPAVFANLPSSSTTARSSSFSRASNP